MKKNIQVVALLLIFSNLLLAQSGTTDSNSDIRDAVTNSGLGLGAIIAVVISWDRNKSILWAIIHGVLGWLYVIYFAIIRLIKGRD
ncbi:hypothetical protein CMU89_05035 [Elizabethkingia anophelis]|uniref:hypothetical protein n=1 Tax=Elizabethkingia anophelis TaxID=1117645 RepID=UPI000389E6C5|nr:hypothetical protein [Elizabethkingia anophelis]EQB92945.1 hypothetical protein C874_17600 [Elizabethkingia anophelis 502]MCT3697317.1 hypothetical protein [Elizabethkingia anophelis]MCT3959120.1 hypothetical protein [Elizabethkingia anophelis]MCT4285176.1 hypothetical protein [Elizabethkingia anophelis]MDV3506545.1 hypothetical protein [Elizabethkingia anophelis]